MLAEIPRFLCHLRYNADMERSITVNPTSEHAIYLVLFVSNGAGV
jgi:hypothetical protein